MTSSRLVGVSNPTGPKTYSSTFPPEPPPSLIDPDVIAAHDQRAFHGLDELLRHWDRPHRPSYHWLIPVGDDVAAVDLATRCQRYLPDAGLDPIPGPWIHLTVKRAGYQDEIGASEVKQLLWDVAERVSEMPSFRVRLIPLAGSPGAVRLSVAPWEPLMNLFHSVSFDTIAEGDPKPKDVFRPHVGVAYSAAQQQPKLIQASAQRAAEELDPVDVEVKRLSLVAMRRVAGWYEWTEVGSAPLS